MNQSKAMTDEHPQCHAAWREQRDSLVDTGHTVGQLALAHDMFFAGWMARASLPIAGDCGHHANCGWNVDQYNWECDCGFLGETTMKAITPTPANVMGEDELREAIMAEMRTNRFPVTDALLQILAMDAIRIIYTRTQSEDK